MGMGFMFVLLQKCYKCIILCQKNYWNFKRCYDPERYFRRTEYILAVIQNSNSSKCSQWKQYYYFQFIRFCYSWRMEWKQTCACLCISVGVAPPSAWRVLLPPVRCGWRWCIALAVSSASLAVAKRRAVVAPKCTASCSICMAKLQTSMYL